MIRKKFDCVHLIENLRSEHIYTETYIFMIEMRQSFISLAGHESELHQNVPVIFEWS